MNHDSAARLELIAPPNFPAVHSGDPLPELIARSLRENEIEPRDHDVLVVAQKVVSKSEDRCWLLADVDPSPQALELAGETGKDARLVELILRESTAVLRATDNLLITEHRLGMVMANAGVDQSNVGDGRALLLPVDPDASARQIRRHLAESTGADVGVIIADSVGRAWRNGIMGQAIGLAGVVAVRDLRGMPDLNGRPLKASESAVADEIAAAATLLMGQAAEGRPVVLVRGLRVAGNARADELLRSRERDLFR